jgi:DNA primase
MAGGRIPESFIQDLLARTDIVEVISSRVELKRAGKEFRGLSPFTHEKSPSFFVNPVKQMFFDFSSGKNGNVIGFLMEFDRLSYVEAIEDLARNAGLEVPREGGHSVERLVLDGPLDAMAAAQRFFREQLRKYQPAIDYLKKRGVSGETAKAFGIGYAPESWDALTKFFQDTKHAVDAGLLIKRDDGSGVYDRFRNRVMFPIRDARGRTIAFGGRTLGNDPAKYLNSPETPLFHKGRNLFGLYEARQSDSKLPYLIVVEGYMDVVMLAQHGIQEAVATLGTATTQDHLHLLFKSTSKVVFCFDGDRAGRAAAWRALEQALPEVYEGRECVFMFLPDGHDPDTLVQEIGAEEFRRRIGEALSLSEFLLGELGKQVNNLGSMDGRARMAALARPHIEKLRKGPLRALILDELSRITRLSRADMEATLNRPQANGGSTPSSYAPNVSPGPSRAESGATRPIKRAMQLLIERPALAERVDHLELLAQSDTPGVEFLIEMIDFFHAHPEAHVAQLLEFWRDTPKSRALERLLQQEVNVDESTLEREFLETIAHLCQKGLRFRVQSLLAEARLRPLTEAETREIASITRELAIRAPA